MSLVKPGHSEGSDKKRGPSVTFSDIEQGRCPNCSANSYAPGNCQSCGYTGVEEVVRESDDDYWYQEHRKALTSSVSIEASVVLEDNTTRYRDESPFTDHATGAIVSSVDWEGDEIRTIRFRHIGENWILNIKAYNVSVEKIDNTRSGGEVYVVPAIEGIEIEGKRPKGLTAMNGKSSLFLGKTLLHYHESSKIRKIKEKLA